jgi:hypothetical protein
MQGGSHLNPFYTVKISSGLVQVKQHSEIVFYRIVFQIRVPEMEEKITWDQLASIRPPVPVML